MHRHTLTLLGGTHDELRVPASVLLEGMEALLEGARLATRFSVEGESVRKGPRPAWLDAACALTITGLTAGSAAVAVEAPTLREADPTRFGDQGQRSLFHEDEADFADRTAVDLFGQVLASVVEQDPDDVEADRALLDACIWFAQVSGGGFEDVRLDGIRGRSTPLVITSEHVPRMELLRDETPAPKAVRVSGDLETISASSSEIVLKLSDGTKVPVAASVAQDAASGVNAFFGTWPGEETDEELLGALKAIG